MQWIPSLRVAVREAWQHRSVKLMVIPSMTLLFVHWALHIWKLTPLAGRMEPIPVHYSVQIGIDRLLPWYWTLAAPIIATAAFLVNCSIIVRLRRKNRLELALLLGMWTIFLLALFFVSTFLTVLLNVPV